MQRNASVFIHGALAGALGAAGMTVLRLLAHRAGWIEAMVPQAVEVWVKDRSSLTRPRAPATHHVADQLLHLAYGGFWGGVYGLAAPKHPSPARALAFGGAIWALGSLVLFPALKIARPLWQAKAREELVNVGAHALYGAIATYMLDELEKQARHQPLSYRRMLRADVG
ncbi:MAG TPA: hypothetical protein VNN80_19010 [Polyangiaceae bacterium]|nr:hypothetical protein [Polyangiaceae bacterium]